MAPVMVGFFVISVFFLPYTTKPNFEIIGELNEYAK